VCFSMPGSRFDPERVEEWGRAVRKAANDISGASVD
jgi:IclR family transcriptional regulator, acetate operon repressor